MGTHREPTPLQVPRHSALPEQASCHRTATARTPRTHRPPLEVTLRKLPGSHPRGPKRGFAGNPRARSGPRGGSAHVARAPARSARAHRSTLGRLCTPPKGARVAGRSWPASLGFQAWCPAARPNIGSRPLSTRGCLRSNSGSRTPHSPPSGVGRARRLRAHLDALVARAGRHPPPVEIERYIMDEVLVVRRDAACHKHGSRRARAFSVGPSRLGRGQPRPRADHGPPGPRGPDVHGACGLRAPVPRPSSRHAPGGGGECACVS